MLILGGSAPGRTTAAGARQEPHATTRAASLLHHLALAPSTSPAWRYLSEARGLDPVYAENSDVSWCVRADGHPWLVFPVRDRGGQTVAHQLRQIDGDRHHAVGSKRLGVYGTTPLENLLDQAAIPITEAPIDALSIAEAGLDAIALNGMGMPDWLPQVLVGRLVLLAFDADAAGDAASERLGDQLRETGVRRKRWRPALESKDWNGLLLAWTVKAIEYSLTRVLA